MFSIGLMTATVYCIAILLGSATLLSTAVAYALDMSPQPAQAPPVVGKKITPVLVQNANGIFLDCGPGLKAQLMINNRPGTRYKTSLQFSETTCGHFMGDMTCSLDLSLKANKVAFLWTENPNPSLLNKPLMYKKAEADKLQELSLQSDIESFYTRKHNASTDMGPDILSCPKFDWMPAEAQKNSFITTWYASTMTTNKETGVSENRTSDALVGVHLQKQSPTSYMLADYDEVQTRTVSFIHPLIDSQQTMIFTDEKTGEACQVNWIAQIPSSEVTRFIAEINHDLDHPTPVKGLDLPFTSDIDIIIKYAFKDGILLQ